MTAIQIQGITAEDFLAKIRDEIAQRIPPPDSNPPDDLMMTLIDRGFITRNLKISYKRIMAYEAEGVLRRVFNPADDKGVFYHMSDYVAVRKMELERLQRRTLNQ